MRNYHQKLLQVLRHSPTVCSRFWAFVERTDGPDDCWLWRGGSTPAELRLTVGQFTVPATRLAWFIATGELPDGGRIGRACANERCVRPSHLTWQVGRVTALRVQGAFSGYAPRALIPNPSAGAHPHAARLQYVIGCTEEAIPIALGRSKATATD